MIPDLAERLALHAVVLALAFAGLSTAFVLLLSSAASWFDDRNPQKKFILPKEK